MCAATGFTVLRGLTVGTGYNEIARDALVRERDFTFITGPRDNPESRPKSRDKARGKNAEECPASDSENGQFWGKHPLSKKGKNTPLD